MVVEIIIIAHSGLGRGIGFRNIGFSHRELVNRVGGGGINGRIHKPSIKKMFVSDENAAHIVAVQNFPQRVALGRVGVKT